MSDKSTTADWPQHSDGRNKTVGEMTKEERRAVFSAAAVRIKRRFEDPNMRAAIGRVLSDDSA